MKNVFVLTVFLLLVLSSPRLFGQDFVPVPEDCSTPWDDNGDGNVNEGCPQAAAFTNPATGEYIAPLEDCVLQGMETAADSDPIHSGTIVRLSNSLPWNRQQIKCAGTFAAGTYTVYLVYRGTTQILNIWAALDSPLNNYPGNATQASFLTQSSGWKADVPIGTVGSLAQFYACVYQSNCANQTSPRTFALNGAHSFYLKFSPGVEGACLYAVNPAAATPNPRCTGAEGTPTSNYVFLRTTNTITLDHADLGGANVMTFTNPSNNNAATITVRGLWKDDTTNRAYIQYETNDADIVTVMSVNDGTFSTAEDHFDFRFRNGDTNQLTDLNLYQILGNFGPFFRDANFPSGTADTSTSLNASISVSGGKMLLSFDLPAGIAAGSQFLCNANARNRSTAGVTTQSQMHGTTTSALVNLNEYGVCETSNTLVNPGAPDTTAPTVSACSAVSITPTSFLAQCTTNEAGTAWVEYDLDNDSAVAGADKVTLGGSSVGATTFQLAVTGRPASTLHEWNIKVQDAAGNIGTGAIVDTTTASGATATKFVSSTGSGSACSSGSPCKPQTAINAAVAGDIIEFAAGTYTGSDEMIKPNEGISGTAANKITVRCATDGACFIDAQSVANRASIWLKNNDDWIIEGFNACCNGDGTDGSVVTGIGADNNIVRRTIAWNGGFTNVGGNSGNLWEDVAAFGDDRKLFLSISNSGIIIRRAWAQWQDYTGTGTGPRSSYNLGYSATNDLCENCIGTWKGPATSCGSGGCRAIFGVMMHGTNHRFYGSIAYVLSGDTYEPSKLVDTYDSSVANEGINGTRFFKDVVVYTAQASKQPFLLRKCGVLTGDCRMDNTTEIGGLASSIHSSWGITNRVDVDNVGSAPNIWNGGGTSGARVCKRYVNGTLTTTPLWPWPMNQRIIDAMTAAGKTPVDVTATMESIFGTIPEECWAP